MGLSYVTDEKKPLLLKGAPVAETIFEKLRHLSHTLRQATQKKPGLCVVRVGHLAPSNLYVARKSEMAKKLGFFFQETCLEQETDTASLIKTIQQHNNDPRVHGLILQLPLPTGINVSACLSSIAYRKDVDGLSAAHRGALYSPLGDGFVPCTPWGCAALLRAYNIDIKGKHVVVVGRSVLVGRPLAALFLRLNATVTVAHRHTKNLKSLTKSADILCVAAGQEKFIDASYVGAESVVMDIGIHQTKRGIVGDVDFEKVAPMVRAITPVPGGVGPLTVMGLMHNTMKAAFEQCGQIFHF